MYGEIDCITWIKEHYPRMAGHMFLRSFQTKRKTSKYHTFCIFHINAEHTADIFLCRAYLLQMTRASCSEKWGGKVRVAGAELAESETEIHLEKVWNWKRNDGLKVIGNLKPVPSWNWFLIPNPICQSVDGLRARSNSRTNVALVHITHASQKCPLSFVPFVYHNTFLHSQICPSYACLFPDMVCAFTPNEVIHGLDFSPQFTFSAPTHIGGFIFM